MSLKINGTGTEVCHLPMPMPRQAAPSNVALGVAHRLGKVMGDVCHMLPGLCMGMLLPRVLEREMSEGGYHICGPPAAACGIRRLCKYGGRYEGPKSNRELHDLLKNISEANGGIISRIWKDAQVSEDTLQDIAQRAGGNEAGFDMNGCMKILREAREGK